MRIIDNNQTGASLPARTERAGQVQPAGSTGAGRVKGAAGDQVELSGFAGKISASLKADASSHADRVRSIAEAVRSGSYKVDSMAVSKALVSQAISGGQSE